MKPSDFRAYGTNWYADLPPHLGSFFGQSINIKMDRCLPEELQQPSARDMKLLGEILTDLPQILAKAKSEFEQFENPSFIDQIDNPTIWISCGDIQWQPKWAWVIERLDHPSYGCHIEFEGLEFKEIWAGD